MAAVENEPTDQRPRYSRKPVAERKQLLIEAAIACLSDGGVAGFTIDRISKRAGISKGLISHHFSGKADLLAQTYAAMTAYLDDAAGRHIERAETSPRLALRDLIDANFDTGAFDRSRLRAWLALWGETAGNPDLLAIHRRRYDRYRSRLAQIISRIADDAGREVDAGLLATMLIALIDGLWLEWCLDASRVSQAQARSAVYALLEPHLGPLGEQA